MNGQQMIHRGLLQKELRQLLPLAIAVVLLTVLFGVLLAISNDRRLAESGQSALFLLIAPAAFSVGAGAMSVGQDKESRTLDWLKTLPVSAQSLASTKLTATLIYFAGLWVLVYVSGFVISWFDRSFMITSPVHVHPLTSEWAWYRIGLSTYVLFCGFLTAWYFSTAMVSLIAIVPLSILPATISWAIAYAMHPGLSFNSSMYDATLASAMVPIVLFTVGAAWLSFRFAHRHLDPAESKDDPSLFQRWNPYAQAESAIRNDSTDTSNRVVSPISAMLWQSWLQNRIIYFCLVTIAAVGAILYYRATFAIDDHYPRRVGGSSPAVGVILIWFATTWMGVSVFLGDSMRDRIRFFADRGVSPTGIWLTRMWIPLSFVFASALVYSAMLWRNADSIDRHISVPMFFIGLLIAFGWSQWFSQFGGGPILNFIVAPPFALAMIIYLSYVSIALYTPFWFLGICVIVPFIMTWLMTGRWMDRKSGRSKFVPHLSVVAFIVLLPIVNGLWQVWSTPTMPRAMRAELKAAMASANLDPTRNLNLYFSPNQLVSRRLATDVAPIDAKEREAVSEDVEKYFDADAVLAYFRQWLAGGPANVGSTGSVTVDNTLMNELSGRVLLARLAMEQAFEREQAGGNVDPVAEPNVSANESVQGYRDAFELLWEVTVSLRRSEFLASQEAADWGEIFLIRELQHPFANDRIGEPLRSSALRLVGDMGGRNAARKRAVMVLWFRNEASNDNEPAIAALANFNFYYNARGELFRSFALRRRFDHFIYGLLTALEAGPQLSNEAKEKFLKDRMASLFLIVSGVHEFVPETFPSYVVDNPLEHQYGVFPNALPGGQWFAGWELVGRDLANQSNASEVSR